MEIAGFNLYLDAGFINFGIILNKKVPNTPIFHLQTTKLGQTLHSTPNSCLGYKEQCDLVDWIFDIYNKLEEVDQLLNYVKQNIPKHMIIWLSHFQKFAFLLDLI